MGHRAAEGAGLLRGYRFFGDAEVDKHHAIMIVQQHIAGLKITMHDGRCLRVHVGEHVAELAHPGRHHVQRYALIR